MCMQTFRGIQEVPSGRVQRTAHYGLVPFLFLGGTMFASVNYLVQYIVERWCLSCILAMSFLLCYQGMFFILLVLAFCREPRPMRLDTTDLEEITLRV